MLLPNCDNSFRLRNRGLLLQDLGVSIANGLALVRVSSPAARIHGNSILRKDVSLSGLEAWHQKILYHFIVQGNWVPELHGFLASKLRFLKVPYRFVAFFVGFRQKENRNRTLRVDSVRKRCVVSCLSPSVSYSSSSLNWEFQMRSPCRKRLCKNFRAFKSAVW